MEMEMEMEMSPFFGRLTKKHFLHLMLETPHIQRLNPDV